jgi:uncharacterized lipoprotein
MRKMLAWVFLLGFVVVMLSGCGDGSTKEQAKDTEKKELKKAPGD